MAKPQDKWPKYWAPESAFKISSLAIEVIGLDPTAPFDQIPPLDKLYAAYLTAKWERDNALLGDSARRP